jgi:hypothetical protein
MSLEKIEAPFNIDVVQALNEYQTSTGDSRPMHPFTCGNRSEPGHSSEGGDLGLLVATDDGWVCPFCEYTQQWSHAFMADRKAGIPPFPWDKTTPRERDQEKYNRAIKVKQEYVALDARLPCGPGIKVMIDCMNVRILNLEAKLGLLEG